MRSAVRDAEGSEPAAVAGAIGVPWAADGGELAESSALSRTAVSHHIKLLEQAGFIEISKDAARRICSVRADRWLPLLDELSSALKADLAAAEQCRA